MRCKICLRIYTVTEYNGKTGSKECPHCRFKPDIHKGTVSLRTYKMGKAVSGKTRSQAQHG